MASERQKIIVERSRYSQRDASQLETDALNGVGSIPGVSDVEIDAADSGCVTLSYTWSGSQPFDRTDEHLKKYGICRRWPENA